MTVVGIFCSSREASLFYEYAVIQSIALLYEFGYKKLSYGGGNSGLMGVVYKEARKHEMHIVGHNLERWSLPELDNEIVYATLQERQSGLMNSSDMYLVFPGGVGTMYEFFQALCQNDVDHLNKPIILFNSYQIFDPLIELFNGMIKMRIMDPHLVNFHVVTTIDELRIVLDYLTKNLVKNEIKNHSNNSLEHRLGDEL